MATARKAAAKKTGAKKTAAKKAPAKTAAKKAPAKTAAKKAAGAKKAEGKASGAASSKDNYTDPALREKIKKEVVAGSKGGRPGQWSARKAQMVAHEYEAEGGGYKHARTDAQRSLKSWGDEHWHTADNQPAIQGGETHRYLPDAAWEKLSDEEKKATDRKKVAGSRKGKQFVSNTAPAARARKQAVKKKG